MNNHFPACPLPSKSPVVAYARVSPGPRQDITSQRNYLKAYAEYYQLDLLRIFEDRARSGGGTGPGLWGRGSS